MDAKSIFIIGLICAYVYNHIVKYLNLSYQSQEKNFRKTEKIIDFSKKQYESLLEEQKNEFKSSLFLGFINCIAVGLFVVLGGFRFLEYWAGLVSSQVSSSVLAEGILFSWMVIFVASSFSSLFEVLFDFFGSRFLGKKGAVKRSFVDALREEVINMATFFIASAFFLVFFDGLIWVFADGWIWALILFVFSLFLIINILFPWWKRLKNTYESLDPSNEASQVVRNLCEKIGFSSDHISVVKKSNESRPGRAYISRFGKKEIVFYDNLLKALSPREVGAIFMHEVGHFKLAHLWWRLVASLVILVSTLWGLSVWVSQSEVAFSFGLSPDKSYVLLLMFVMFYALASPLVNTLIKVFVRKQEYEADRYSYEHFPGPYLAQALVKLGVDLNKGIPFCHPVYSFLNNSHPTIVERVLALKKLEEGR